MSTYTISELQKSDYFDEFLQLLEQLTIVDANEISYDAFCEQFDKCKSKVFVIRQTGDFKIIGTASVLIEEKFIHKLSSVGHIEDVVVDKEYRDKGLGKLLINHCIEYIKNNGCYKVILSCSDKYVEFYRKCGFSNKNVEMSLYLH